MGLIEKLSRRIKGVPSERAAAVIAEIEVKLAELAQARTAAQATLDATETNRRDLVRRGADDADFEALELAKRLAERALERAEMLEGELLGALRGERDSLRAAHLRELATEMPVAAARFASAAREAHAAHLAIGALRLRGARLGLGNEIAHIIPQSPWLYQDVVLFDAFEARVERGVAAVLAPPPPALPPAAREPPTPQELAAARLAAVLVPRRAPAAPPIQSASSPAAVRPVPNASVVASTAVVTEKQRKADALASRAAELDNGSFVRVIVLRSGFEAAALQYGAGEVLALPKENAETALKNGAVEFVKDELLSREATALVNAGGAT